MGIGNAALGKGLVEALQIVLDGCLVEMVNHIAGTAGGGAFHLLACATLVLRHDEPGAGEAEHLQTAVFHVVREVEAATLVTLHVDGVNHDVA